MGQSRVEINAFDLIDASLMLITMKTALHTAKAIDKDYHEKVKAMINKLQSEYKSQLNSKEIAEVSERITEYYGVNQSPIKRN